MRSVVLKSGEKRLLIAAIVAACLIGSFAGYVAYLDEAEAQFHGGVLEEDASEAQLALIWEPTTAFARWAIGIVLIVGVAPIGVRRLVKRVST
jgi:Na+/proline symporter